MRKHSERSRFALERRSTERRERTGQWIERGAHLSQVLLLALGVFGYFYTVVPVYQKSLLDEEIAQKTLEVREQQKQSTALTKKITEQQIQVEAKERDLAAARLAENAAKAEARETYERLRIQYVGVVAHSLRRCGDSVAREGLKGDELEKCPGMLLVGAKYDLDNLRPKDVALFERMLRAKLTSLQPSYRTMVQGYESRVVAYNAKIAELEKRAEEEKAKPDGGFKPIFDLLLARDQIGTIKREAYFGFAKVLDDAGDALFRDYLDRVAR